VLLFQAKKSGDLKTALVGIDKALKCLELMAKIQGQIKEQSINVNVSVNVLQSPEWILVRSVLMDALQPYAEARKAVSGALLRIDNRGRNAGK
jgi:alcohol dehydrogenase class IV